MNKFKILALVISNLTVMGAQGFASSSTPEFTAEDSRSYLKEGEMAASYFFNGDEVYKTLESQDSEVSMGYIQTYLNQGHDINEPVDGESWLNWSIYTGNDAPFAWLLDNRANPNVPDSSGVFPIHQIAKNAQGDYLAMIKKLKERGADLNALTQDEKSETALHTIARGMDLIPNLFYALVNSGIDLNVLDKNGCTPLDVLSIFHMNDDDWGHIIEHFKNMGAKLEKNASKSEGAGGSK